MSDGYRSYDRLLGFAFGSGGAWLLILAILGGMWGCPIYNVWQQRMSGNAMLAHSISGKQVAVQEALAKKESASLLADAEVARAIGVAKANKIIGESLKDHEEYLRYLYIQNLADKQNEIVYVPTEAGLPILEAGRRMKPVVIQAEKKE
jgi:regulator of protease activity HflC (stomatin/prohibitin superfamily)